MEFWFTELHTPNVKFSVKVDKHLYTAENDLGRVDIFESPEFGRFLAVDGYIIFTQRDEFIYDEMLSHIPMAVNPNAQKVLVFGSGDGGCSDRATEAWFVSCSSTSPSSRLT